VTFASTRSSSGGHRQLGMLDTLTHRKGKICSS
jgi:hypothetical protein